MPLTVEQLPTLNAALNATATVLLLLGLALIKQRREKAHKIVMLAAFVVSSVFLTTYLIYHLQRLHVEFQGPPAIRAIYLTILLTHVLLAVTVPVLAIWAIVLGLRDRRAKHRRVVRWAFPIWLYVSVTGCVIYWMLYHLYPSA